MVSEEASPPKREASAASKVGSVGEPVLQGEDDEAELGHGALLGLEVDGLGVEEGAASGDDEQAAADGRASLAGSRG